MRGADAPARAVAVVDALDAVVARVTDLRGAVLEAQALSTHARRGVAALAWTVAVIGALHAGLVRGAAASRAAVGVHQAVHAGVDRHITALALRAVVVA